jgi:hypothetical protein
MKRLFFGLLLFVVLVSNGLASYTYFITENLYTPNWSNWSVWSWLYTNPTMTPYWYAPGGYGGIGQNPSTAMTNGTAPTGEVRLTIRATNYVDPDTGNTYGPSGQFYADFGAGTNFSGASCAGLQVLVSINGYSAWIQIYGLSSINYQYSPPYPSYALLAGTTVSVTDGMQVRAVQNGTRTLVYVNNTLVLSYSGSGSAGCGSGMGLEVGNAGTPGTLVQEMDLGPLDTIAPNAIPTSSINQAAYTSHIDLSWPAGTDDPNGTGVYSYSLYRGGQLLASGPSLFSFSDTTVVPNTTYNYTLTLTDYHGNSTSTNFSVTTPHVGTWCSVGPNGQINGPCASATPDGRRTGIVPTGAYWGGGNENIDVLSGNLNFSLPLLKAMGRTSWGVPFNLVYNSQNWRQDSGGAWNYGYDVGYGYGWKLLAGSITPIWNPGGFTANYYLYTDSTGAQYRLDQNNGNIWSSKQSVYVWFDANTNILHFRDGSFWNFACISAGTEPDSGVMYPTLMEDTNGNQILIRYQQAASWANSSARITQIEDVRATGRSATVYATYDFTYNNDSPHHLTSISNSIGTGEAYGFSYSGGQSLYSPMSSQYFGTVAWLSSAVITNLTATHMFSYNSSGELTNVTLPYGGYLAYDYTTTNYSGGPSYREVAHRYLSPDGTTASQLTYPLTHESSPVAPVHTSSVITDPSGNGDKLWTFANSGWTTGLVSSYQGRQYPGAVPLTAVSYGYGQDAVGNTYLYQTETNQNPWSAAMLTSSVQTVDQYGNVTQVLKYDYGSGAIGPLMRTYNYSYLNSSAYTSRYIYNRLTSATVTDASNNTTTLATNYYDSSVVYGCNVSGSLASVSGLREWDTAYSNVFYRGNLACSITPGGLTQVFYDQSGNVVSTNVNGVTTQVSTASSNNFAVPTQLTVGSLTTTLGWSSFLGLTNEAGPNGDGTSTTYDQYARASNTTSPFGATTTMTYSNFTNPPTTGQTVTATTNGRWSRKTLDGLGHTGFWSRLAMRMEPRAGLRVSTLRAPARRC